MRGDRLRLPAGRFFGFLRIPRKITEKAAYLPVEALMRIVSLGHAVLALLAGVGAAQGGAIEFHDKGVCHVQVELLRCRGGCQRAADPCRLYVGYAPRPQDGGKVCGSG